MNKCKTLQRLRRAAFRPSLDKIIRILQFALSSFQATVLSICVSFVFQRGKPIFLVWAYHSTSDVQLVEQEV